MKTFRRKREGPEVYGTSAGHQGKERKRSVCVGRIIELTFSPDGQRVAAVVVLGFFESMAETDQRGIARVAQIRVWQVAGEGDALKIEITHPCGEWVEMWPSNEKVKPLSGEQIQAAILKVFPKRLRFSPDGKTLICETEAGLRTVYDLQTGVMLQNPGMASVGLFKSMLMIALQQVPTDVESLTMEITPREKSIRLEQASDDWWQLGQDEKSPFKVDGNQFVSRAGDVETKEEILMRLGLKTAPIWRIFRRSSIPSV